MNSLRIIAQAVIIATGIAGICNAYMLPTRGTRITPKQTKEACAQLTDKKIARAAITPDQNNIATIVQEGTQKDPKYKLHFISQGSIVNTQKLDYWRHEYEFHWKDNETLVIGSWPWDKKISINNYETSIVLPRDIAWLATLFGHSLISLLIVYGLPRINKINANAARKIYTERHLVAATSFAYAAWLAPFIDSVIRETTVDLESARSLYLPSACAVAFLNYSITLGLGIGREKTVWEFIARLWIIYEIEKQRTGKPQIDMLEGLAYTFEDKAAADMMISRSLMDKGSVMSAMRFYKQSTDSIAQRTEKSFLEIYVWPWVSKVLRIIPKQNRLPYFIDDIDQGIENKELCPVIEGWRTILETPRIKPLEKAELHAGYAYLLKKINPKEIKDAEKACEMTGTTTITECIKRESERALKQAVILGCKNRPPREHIGEHKAWTIGGSELLKTLVVFRAGTNQSMVDYYAKHSFVAQHLGDKVPIPLGFVAGKESECEDSYVAVAMQPRQSLEDKFSEEELEKTIESFIALHRTPATIVLQRLNYIENLLSRVIEGKKTDKHRRLGRNQLLERLLAEWESLIYTTIDQTQLVVSHGDAHLSNCLHGGMLIDFEKLCLTPPMYDISHLLADPRIKPERFFKIYCAATGASEEQFTPNIIYNSFCLFGAMLAQGNTEKAADYLRTTINQSKKFGFKSLAETIKQYCREAKALV